MEGKREGKRKRGKRGGGNERKKGSKKKRGRVTAEKREGGKVGREGDRYREVEK